MPELEIKRLVKHSPISGSANNKYKNVIFGSLFVIAGIIFIIIVSHNRPPGDQSEMPFPLVISTLLFFPFFGIWIIIASLKEIFRNKKMENIQKFYPNEPWRWDYSWDSTGINDRSVKSAEKAFGFGIFLTLFLMPFNWVAFISGQIPEARITCGLIVGFFDLLVIMIFGYSIYLFSRKRKYGPGRLKFISFPYFPGSELNVTFQTEKKLSDIRQLKATLRFIEERYEMRGGNIETICYQLYADTLTLTGQDFKYNNLLTLDLKFSLPQNGCETKLKDRPAKYWELEIMADTHGIDYHASFLLPIYSSSY
ncbi:MAG: hypothetical protein AB1498_10050 [bacterium]